MKEFAARITLLILGRSLVRGREHRLGRGYMDMSPQTCENCFCVAGR